MKLPRLTKRQRRQLLQILAAGGLLLLALLLEHLLHLPWWIQLPLYGAAYLVVGLRVLQKAGRGILHRQFFDENFLMSVATLAAFAIREYPEAAEVMLFYQVGTLFEQIAVGRSREAVSALLDLCPDEATVLLEDGREETVLTEEIEVGTRILVKPGEKIPLDSVVEAGEALIDTAALTGESVPQAVAPGAQVYSGCVNLNAPLTLRAERTAQTSTAAKIMELVEESAARKAQTEQFITRFARWYTPAVVGAAVLLAVLPPLLLHQPIAEWVYRALTFLIISCPCALVISVPLAFFGGIGAASKQGILVKGSNCLEALSHARTVVMDKTGTLTQGKFSVTEVRAVNGDTQTLLRLTACAEMQSNHPLAQAVRRAYTGRTEAAQITETAGGGVSAVVQGQQILAGTAAFLRSSGVDVPPAAAPGTVIHTAADGVYLGGVYLADAMKPHAPAAVQAMRQAGVRELVMLTGDNEAAAETVAEALSLSGYHAGCLPADKVRLMEDYRKRLQPGEKLVFVGDGLNDAPVLVQSDVGIAMGGLGSDAAIEAADVVILDDDLRKIPAALSLSRRIMGIVRENIVFALGVKAVVLLLGALGYAPISLAVFADVGVSVLAILNSIRGAAMGRRARKSE